MVVDFALPDMSGFDLLERLKKELGLYDLPIIVYTAKEQLSLLKVHPERDEKRTE